MPANLELLANNKGVELETGQVEQMIRNWWSLPPEFKLEPEKPKTNNTRETNRSRKLASSSRCCRPSKLPQISNLSFEKRTCSGTLEPCRVPSIVKQVLRRSSY
jgi:hypothetical protein